MTVGPGKYDAEATKLHETTKSQGVLLMVFGGDRGTGMSCKMPLHMMPLVPHILRDIADELERGGHIDRDIEDIRGRN